MRVVLFNVERDQFLDCLRGTFYPRIGGWQLIACRRRDAVGASTPVNRLLIVTFESKRAGWCRSTWATKSVIR